MENSKNTLRVENIRKIYESGRGIENINFSLKPGEVMGVIGVNGSGKTTTFKCLLHLLSPDEGKIYIGEEELNESHKSLFGYLPEERCLYKDLKVYEQITLIGELRKMSREAIENAMDYWIERMNITNLYDSKIEELSKGNQQKIQFICAILHDPSIIVLDEPLSGLDAINAEMFKEIIEELRKKKKIILLSSHQFEYIEEFFQKVLLIKNGEQKWYGEVAKLKHMSEHRYIRIVTDKKKEYYLEDGVISQNVNGQSVRLMMEDETKAVKLFRKLLRSEPLNSMTIELPTLKDIVLERELL